MAVIEHNRTQRKAGFGALLALLFVAALPLRADRAADVRAQVSYVASALGSGNPTDALGPFDKSCKDYQKLKGYFQALTAGFEITSEVEVLNEQDEETETKLLVNWILTLTNTQTATDLTAGSSERRSVNVNLRLIPQNGKWKIVDLSPVEFFNPQEKQPPTKR